MLLTEGSKEGSHVGAGTCSVESLLCLLGFYCWRIGRDVVRVCVCLLTRSCTMSRYHHNWLFLLVLDIVLAQLLAVVYRD
ncbi:uncharacterized protein EI90DRAFT_3073585, partial [Cantharellus anzutake]|uniref:uncharacterized protein n=1 Tax=Cantharellus anzutake TaxID=1750568 RepID=UPI001908E970